MSFATKFLLLLKCSEEQLLEMLNKMRKEREDRVRREKELECKGQEIAAQQSRANSRLSEALLHGRTATTTTKTRMAAPPKKAPKKQTTQKKKPLVVRPKVVGDPVGPTGFEWDEEKGVGRFELEWTKGGLLWDSLPEVVLQDFPEECLVLVWKDHWENVRVRNWVNGMSRVLRQEIEGWVDIESYARMKKWPTAFPEQAVATGGVDESPGGLVLMVSLLVFLFVLCGRESVLMFWSLDRTTTSWMI